MLPAADTKEPLLQATDVVSQSSTGRFLSQPFYQEKMAGFRKV